MPGKEGFDLEKLIAQRRSALQRQNQQVADLAEQQRLEALQQGADLLRQAQENPENREMVRRITEAMNDPRIAEIFSAAYSRVNPKKTVKTSVGRGLFKREGTTEISVPFNEWIRIGYPEISVKEVSSGAITVKGADGHLRFRIENNQLLIESVTVERSAIEDLESYYDVVHKTYHSVDQYIENVVSGIASADMDGDYRYLVKFSLIPS